MQTDLVKIAWDLCFDPTTKNEDEEQKTKRRSLVRNKNYFEKIVPRFEDKQFKEHFRLTRECFEKLLKLIEIEHRHSEIHAGRPEIELEKQVLITLWYLGNTECFRSIADRFGICIATAWKTIFQNCEYLLTINVEHGIIAWPDGDSCRRTADHFERKTKFPGVIGCIDRSHIPIPKPKVYPNSYLNSKKKHSVLLQAVCNEKMIFLDCYAGEAGSIPVSCLFRRSNLFKKISDGRRAIDVNHHLLGDQGYELKTYLLTPYKDCGNFNNEQKNYNNIHSYVRMVIARAFATLKGRFRRLQKLHTRRPDFIPLFIMSACILHNFCIKNDDILEESFTALYEEDASSNYNNEENESDAVNKRDAIARIVQYE